MPTELELKQIEELEQLAVDVSNGDADNIRLQGMVIGKLATIFCVVFRKGIMTLDECVHHGSNGDTKNAPRIKFGALELTGFKFRDLERWAILAGLIWLLLSQHGVVPSPFAKKIAIEVARSVIVPTAEAVQ